MAPDLPATLVSAMNTGSNVVVGPPGSGKTTIAVGIANRRAAGIRTEFVVASKHLVEWLRPRVSRGVAVMTWRDWLSRTYAEVVGGPVPRRTSGGERGIDWKVVLRGIESAAPKGERLLLVDEAQDIPHRLVSAMRKHATDLIAFADPFQRHAVDGSSLEQLIDAIEQTHPWPAFVLEEDFRTTREIQRFAVAAWAPERSDPCRPATQQGEAPTLRHGTFDDVAVQAATFLEGSVGTVMIASSHADRAPISEALRKRGTPVNRGSDSDTDKVSCLAFEALRGLEFDAVVLVPPSQPLGTWEETAADLYVAATRAKRLLAVFVVAEPFPELSAALHRAAPLWQGGRPVDDQ